MIWRICTTKELNVIDVGNNKTQFKFYFQYFFPIPTEAQKCVYEAVNESISMTGWGWGFAISIIYLIILCCLCYAVCKDSMKTPTLSSSV